MDKQNVDLFKSVEEKYTSERLRQLKMLGAPTQTGAVLETTIDRIIKNRRALNVDRVKINESIKPWSISQKRQQISHLDGRYFSVEFFNIIADASREESAWIQPLIVEKNQPAGILGQIVAVKDGIVNWLVHIKSEPGDVKGYNVTTTIQATYENLCAPRHSSKVPGLSDFIAAVRENATLFSVPVQEDGGRYFQKVNQLIAVEIEFNQNLERDNLVWVEQQILMHLFTKNDIPISAQLRFMMSQFLV